MRRFIQGASIEETTAEDSEAETIGFPAIAAILATVVKGKLILAARLEASMDEVEEEEEDTIEGTMIEAEIATVVSAETTEVADLIAETIDETIGETIIAKVRLLFEHTVRPMYTSIVLPSSWEFHQTAMN